MERLFDIKVSQNVQIKFKENSQKLASDPLNIIKLIIFILFFQTPD